MNFERILLSNIVLIPLGLAVLVAVPVAFLPLAGVLGFEYSAIMGFALSLISVFMSAEIMDRDQKGHSAGRRLSDRVSAVFMVNIIMLLLVFLVGLASSLIKDDCNIREGAVFYLLITCVSVFFSASLGMLTGFLLRRRGFIVGALIIIGTIVYSLYVLYSEPSLFVYSLSLIHI
jgi:putative Mn2+ efflux pump MntP